MRDHGIRKPEAERQIRRLAAFGRRWADLAPEGIAELVRTLMLCCDSEAMASLVMDDLLRNEWMPTPHDVIAAADSVVREAERQATSTSRNASRGCRICRGCGYRLSDYLVTYRLNDLGHVIGRDVRELAPDVAARLRGEVDGIAQVVVEGVAPCQCDYGQALRDGRRRYADEERAMAMHRREKLSRTMDARRRRDPGPSEVHVP